MVVICDVLQRLMNVTVGSAVWTGFTNFSVLLVTLPLLVSHYWFVPMSIECFLQAIFSKIMLSIYINTIVSNVSGRFFDHVALPLVHQSTHAPWLLEAACITVHYHWSLLQAICLHCCVQCIIEVMQLSMHWFSSSCATQRACLLWHTPNLWPQLCKLMSL